MLAKLILACWMGVACTMLIPTNLLSATPSSPQQRILNQESPIEPERLQQILTWISQTWELPYSEVSFDYEKDLVLISPSPTADATYWKVAYRGGCAIVDLADLL